MSGGIFYLMIRRPGNLVKSGAILEDSRRSRIGIYEVSKPSRLSLKCLAMVVVQIGMFVGLTLVGRWIQLHQEKVFPKGSFVGPNSRGARLARAEVDVVGIFAVFGGTTATITLLLSLIPIHIPMMSVFDFLLAAAAGVFAAVRVRKQVKALPTYQSTDPNGWWPS